jgi:epoxyqueuosine reductase QueG
MLPLRGVTPMKKPSDIDPVAAKQAIIEYCLRKGALVAGVADLDAVERIAPAGHRPSDLMPRVKSVIAVGVGGATQGAWRVPAKALSYFGSTESRAYKIVYGLAFFIEQKFGVPAIYCPPDMDPELGARYPIQSLKLHAELAGLGARSLAGDILLHPDYGYMYYASCFTELALPPDKPLAENPCPAPSCVNMFRREGRTPCMKFCPAQCLSGEIDAAGKQVSMHYDMAACAELTQQFETVPQLLRDAIATDDPEEREALLLGERNKVLWYRMSVGNGGLFAQCFECMRVCPIATNAPLADPLKRGAAQRAAQSAKAQHGRADAT